jgi:hypothetical protein
MVVILMATIIKFPGWGMVRCYHCGTEIPLKGTDYRLAMHSHRSGFVICSDCTQTRLMEDKWTLKKFSQELAKFLTKNDANME